MSGKKVHHEEHVDETWLIPYADMLTLLLALFIVMFAMSKTDQEKFEQVANQFNVIFSGGAGIFDENGETFVPSILPNKAASNASMEQDKMNDIKESLEKQINSSGYSDKVKVELTEEGLEISIQDAILFNSGDAAVIKDISPLLSQISSMLGDLDNQVKIIGHTDNVPISSSKYSSNWDLSAARAINVMSFFVEKGTLSPERFSIQGYGEFKPKYNNATADGRAKNRRVEIMIVRKYPAVTEKTKAADSENTKTPVPETSSQPEKTAGTVH